MSFLHPSDSNSVRFKDCDIPAFPLLTAVIIPVILSGVTFFTHLLSLFIVKVEDETLQPQPRFNWSRFKTEQSGFYVRFACQKLLKHPGPVSCGGSKVILRSQVGVSEHGVLLPHSAETFDGVNEFLVVHKLREKNRAC